MPRDREGVSGRHCEERMPKQSTFPCAAKWIASLALAMTVSASFAAALPRSHALLRVAGPRRAKLALEVGGGGSIGLLLRQRVCRGAPYPQPLSSELRSSRPHRFAGGRENCCRSDAGCLKIEFAHARTRVTSPLVGEVGSRAIRVRGCVYRWTEPLTPTLSHKGRGIF